MHLHKIFYALQFYWYMCTLSVILTILAIYWMAHN
ncbi:LasU family protein [Lactiplantibacillus plantarum]|nr:LasU family protein [Lactiplantibacillus plantarum]WBB03276.1 LasU family protein [Lactiplantibacillus plantarum]